MNETKIKNDLLKIMKADKIDLKSIRKNSFKIFAYIEGFVEGNAYFENKKRKE